MGLRWSGFMELIFLLREQFIQFKKKVLEMTGFDVFCL